MKLARFTANGQTTVGVVQGEHIFERSHVLPSAPRTLREVLAGGAELRWQIAAGLSAAHRGDLLGSVKLKVPGPEAQKVLSIGRNRQKPLTAPIFRDESDVQVRKFPANGE